MIVCDTTINALSVTKLLKCMWYYNSCCCWDWNYYSILQMSVPGRAIRAPRSSSTSITWLSTCDCTLEKNRSSVKNVSRDFPTPARSASTSTTGTRLASLRMEPQPTPTMRRRTPRPKIPEPDWRRRPLKRWTEASRALEMEVPILLMTSMTLVKFTLKPLQPFEVLQTISTTQ